MSATHNDLHDLYSENITAALPLVRQLILECISSSEDQSEVRLVVLFDHDNGSHAVDQYNPAIDDNLSLQPSEHRYDLYVKKTGDADADASEYFEELLKALINNVPYDVTIAEYLLKQKQITVYESDNTIGLWGYTGCESDSYTSQLEAVNAALNSLGLHFPKRALKFSQETVGYDKYEVDLPLFGYGRYEFRRGSKVVRERGLSAAIKFVTGKAGYQSEVDEYEVFIVTKEGERLLFRAWIDQDETEMSDHRFCSKFVDSEFGRLFAFATLKHPYADMTMADVIQIACCHAEWFGGEQPKTLECVRDYLRVMSNNAGHIWITGMASLDLLDSVIDGKNLEVHSRLIA